MSASPMEGTNRPDQNVAAAPGSPVHDWPDPPRGFLFLLGFAGIGASMASLASLVLTLPLKATEIDPQNAIAVLSVASAVGSLFSIIAFPALGRLSDRTTGRFGRRRPFLALGAVLIALGAIGTAAATTPVPLVLASIVTAIGYSAVVVSVTAAIPDQLAPHRRGPASAVVGLGVPVGVLLGLFIAQLVAPNLTAMILLPAAVAVVGALAFAFALRDRPITAAERPPFDLAQLLGTFWVSPRTDPSFAWAWASRLLLYLGVGAIQAYQAFYLIAVLHIPPAGVAGSVFLSTLVLTVTALLFAPLAGTISDRIGRRKPFVIGSSVVFAVGLVFASTASTFGTFLAAMAVVGIGQGVYFAVDIALVTQVLPDPDNPAKDLGLMNLASTLPSALVPALAPAILTIAASAANPQNYTALFLAGAIAGLLGAACILPIRTVR